MFIFSAYYKPLADQARMLFEFHRIQNGKKPGTVHATYLLSGTKRRTEPTVTNGYHILGDQDIDMQSSPFMSSSMPQPEELQEEAQVQSIILAREEHLEGLYLSETLQNCSG